MWDRTPSSASSSPPGPLSGANMEEKLARWDELSPVERDRIGLDPDLGPRLELLQRGEEWLLTGGKPAAPCPSPEALFEYAGGPGSEALAPEARQQVDRHLEHCSDCAGLVRQLGSPPPSHLLEGRPETPRLRLLQGSLLAAAAAVALITLVPRALDTDQPAFAAWPANEVLRGPEGSALHSPGGSLLSSATGASWSRSLAFRMEPLARADSYRVRVLIHSGGAFDQGQAVFETQSKSPSLDVERDLKPGSYTWEAWASIDGRETLLGSRDFEVLEDAETMEIAAEALAADGVERIRILHAARLFDDARRAAEQLPSSPERDAYLRRAR